MRWWSLPYAVRKSGESGLHDSHAGDPRGRHDRVDLPGVPRPRASSVWGNLTAKLRHGPWHLVGSGVRRFDLAMAPLAAAPHQRRSVPNLPKLNLCKRDGFAATVTAAMNSALLSTPDRDRLHHGITSAKYGRRVVAAGRRRVTRNDAVSAPPSISMLFLAHRATSWTVAHDPSQPPRFSR